MKFTLTRELLSDFIQSSLFGHRIYKGGLANTCDIHKTTDLESGARSVTVGGNSLRKNL